MSKIKILRDALGWTQEKVAERLNLSVGQVSKREAGITPLVNLPYKCLIEYAKLYSCSVADLFDDGEDIPPCIVKGAVQAGKWRDAVEWPHSDWYPIFVPEDQKYKGLRRFALEVRGDSMNEVYPEGSIVICVKLIDLGRNPTHGQHVVVYRADKNGLFEATVKEYREEADGTRWLCPRSTRPQHQTPIALDGAGQDIELAALVTGSYSPAP